VVLLNDERIANWKHNYWYSGGFIKQTTCSGPCIGPSSGLNLHIGGDYTVCFFLPRSGSLQTQRDIVALRYTHVCKAITSAKSFIQQCTIGIVLQSRWNLRAHCDAREGKWRGNWRMEWVASTLALLRNLVYPALLPLMRTPRLPVVNWTDAPANLNGLVRFAEIPNLVSTRVPSYFKRSLLHYYTDGILLYKTFSTSYTFTNMNVPQNNEISLSL
jgi:hypothetical protein